MIPSFLFTISLLSSIINSEAQANTVLSYLDAEPTFYPDDGTLTALDDSSHLWLVGRWEDSLYVSRIDPNGNLIMDRVPVPSSFNAVLVSQLEFDSWNNAYFTFFIDAYLVPKYVNLIRVTPQGLVQECYPWKQTKIRLFII